jgi:hypothetical protein
MRFSILIPTFNRPQLLGAAIESALAQTHRDTEVIVIDDGPSEETQSVASRFGSVVRYLQHEHGGKAAALNSGISASNGDAIIVLDDDDLFPPSTIALHERALAKNPAANFSFGRFVRFVGERLPPSTELWDEESVPVGDPRRLVIKLMVNCFLPHPTWAVRREAQLKAGPYNVEMRYSEDYDMILRLARSNEGAFIDAQVLYQRKHLALRGPLVERTFVPDSVDKWLKYDALLFERICREWDLSDFRPFGDLAPLNCDDLGCALLQKGIILFQRKVYTGAMQTLAAYRNRLLNRSPSWLELRIAADLLGCRYGLLELATTAAGIKISNEFRTQRWPRLLRVAFAVQLRWRLRAALATGDVDHAIKLFQFARRTFGMAATGMAMAIGTRYQTWHHMAKYAE